MSGTNPIANYEDIIDSRDVIARIAYLETFEGIEDPVNYDLEDERWELEALRKLAKDGESAASDWQYGATLVRDSYFEDYAEKLANNSGAIDKSAGWPLCHIDWEAAADALRMEYEEIDFDGVTYWVWSEIKQQMEARP